MSTSKPEPKSSLSSVVSNLVRASMGSSVPGTITDDDLDRHVAELILREAKQKLERYRKDGIRAYLPTPDSNAPRTNKRFLSSIIRSTDDHNKTVLRAQALAAQEVRLEREAEERRERRARAQEAVDARRAGGSRDWERGGKRKRSWERGEGREDDYDEERRERRRRRERERGEGREDDEDERRERRPRRVRERADDRRSRSPDEEDRHSGRRRRSRSRSATPSERPGEKGSSGERHHRHRHRRHHRSPGADEHAHARRSHRSRRERSGSRRERSDSRSSYSSHRHARRSRRASPSPPPDNVSRSGVTRADVDGDEDVVGPPTPPRAGGSPSGLRAREDELRLRLKSKGKTRASTHSPARSPTPPLPPSPPPPSRKHTHAPTPAHASSSRTLPSRSPSPAPALPSKMDKYFASSYDPRLDVAPLSAPEVPKTGLVSDAEFAGWDAMLELIRQRREDKEEKKRLERWGVGKDKDKDKDKGKSAKRKGTEGASGGMSGWEEGGVDIMEIQYKKRGSVREWDLGKEGF